MFCVKPSSTVARKLALTLVSASKPSQQWSSTVEDSLRCLLFSLPLPLTPALVSSAIDPHLLHHYSLATGLFHFASHQPNFSHSPLSFHSYLKCLSISRHPHSIISLLKLAQSQRIRLLSSSIALAASSLLLSDCAVEASEILKHADNGLPSALCNSVLAVLSSGGFLGAATQLFDEMLLRGVQFNTVGFVCFIAKFSRAEEVQRTLTLVEKVMKKHHCLIDGSITAAMIANDLCRVGRVDDSWRILQDLRRIDCKPDFISYRIVSEGFKSAGRLIEMESILKQKRKLGVAPRTNEYRNFIFSLISERRILEAKELAEAIVSGDFPMADDVLNALIRTISSTDSDSATIFCKHLIRKGRFLSPQVLRILSKNLWKNDKSGEMWDIFKGLLDKEYFKGVNGCNVLLSFLCKAGRVNEAYDVLNKIKKTSVKPDISSYNLLLESLCRGDLLRPAKKLWDEIFVSGCCANLQTYNILIKKFAQVGESKVGLELFNHMLRKGVVPNDVTYSSSMKLLCQETRMSEVVELFNRCLEQDTALAHSTLRILVLSLCREGNYACASHIMRSVPAKMDCCDSNIILLKSLADAGEISMAAKHVEWVRNNSPSKLQMILAQLHETLSTTPKLDFLLQLLGAVQSHGENSAWTKF